MAPKTKYSREQIIEAAFEIARSEGLDHITTRKVADKLGSSVAPIYVNFKEIDELVREVIKKVADMSKQYVHEINSGKPFLDIGIASIRFANEYSVLFRDLVMKPNEYMQSYSEDMGDELIGLMKKDADLEGFSEHELSDLLFKMRIFQTGLSVMVANGLFPASVSEEQIIELMDRTASELISAARIRKQEVSYDAAQSSHHNKSNEG